MDYLESNAEPSADSTYRYLLKRVWESGPLLGIVMLNPSRANASCDDPTLRKCVKFAWTHDYGGIVVTNLFAYKTPKPEELKKYDRDGVDIVGPENAKYIDIMLDQVEDVLCAWGAMGNFRKQGEAMAALLSQHKPLYCLGMNSVSNTPRHPLYVNPCKYFLSYSPSGKHVG